jgi:hypothetical protein
LGTDPRKDYDIGFLSHKMLLDKIEAVFSLVQHLFQGFFDTVLN